MHQITPKLNDKPIYLAFLTGTTFAILIKNHLFPYSETFMSLSPFYLFNMSGKTKILHLSWMAFFISFVIWFNHAPLMILMKQTFNMSNTQVEIILLLNVALTIPARVIVGLLVDHYGAKISYSALLGIGSLPCFMCAFAENFEQLAWARFFLGFIGAGFVVGVRIIGDWFPSSQIGTAEGVYAGWGNFGSAFAAICLPSVAFYFGDENGWRYAIALTGLVALVYAFVYYWNVENFPSELAGLKTKQASSMEVCSIDDLFLYMLSLLPLYGAMSLLTWKLASPSYPLLSRQWEIVIHFIIWGLFLLHAYQLVKTNSARLSQPIPSIHHYKYKQVFILAIAYLVSFGSKLAVLSMLPMFFFDTFSQTQQISMLDAGFLASSFVVTNVIARPLGGWLSDKIGRKLSLCLFTIGLSIGYLLMSQISANWSITLAVLVTLICSIFMQAAEGAIFAFVPLVRRAITGEVAGIVGAYGNAGAILFLIILTFITPASFFTLLGICCLLLLGFIYYLDEPRNFITQIMPDGSLVKIELE